MKLKKIKEIEFDKYLEYLLMIILILSTRSVYAHMQVNFHFNIMFIIVLAILMVIKYFKKRFQSGRNRLIMFSLFLYYLYISIFMIFNHIYDFSNFVSTFMIILPMLFINYMADKNKNVIRNDLIKFANIVIFISIISLIIYSLGPLIHIVKPTNMIYLKWGNERYINSYFNIHFVTQSANVLGINLYRNTSIFVEAPMYALELLIALSIQLFINRKKQNYKVVILMISIVTTYTATGVATSTIMLIASVILKVLKEKDKKISFAQKTVAFTICCILMILSVYLYVQRKNNTESYNIRIDDFNACFLTWREFPIIGIGHNQTRQIEQNMSEFRMHNTGLSNSVLVLLAQCGIYLSLFYIVPTVWILVCFIKNKKNKELLFVLSIMILFITTIFPYTITMMWLLAILYAYLEKVYFDNEKENKVIKMYIMAHKKFDKPELEGYVPIQVGAKGKANLGYIRDDTGENISSKNSNYCELTGIYWIWKNDSNSDIIGISHYRRYFTTDMIFKSNFISINEIKELLYENDIIIAKKEIYAQNAYEQYCRNSGFAKDLESVKSIIQNKYPSEYLDAFNKVMYGNKVSQFNMMITTKEIYYKYCEWLFEILFELEKNMDLKDYNDYQKRIYGFIAERLLNVWILANDKLKVKRLPTINTEETIGKIIRIKLRRIKNELIFYKNSPNKQKGK